MNFDTDLYTTLATIHPGPGQSLHIEAAHTGDGEVQIRFNEYRANSPMPFKCIGRFPIGFLPKLNKALAQSEARLRDAGLLPPAMGALH